MRADTSPLLALLEVLPEVPPLEDTVVDTEVRLVELVTSVVKPVVSSFDYMKFVLWNCDADGMMVSLYRWVDFARECPSAGGAQTYGGSFGGPRGQAGTCYSCGGYGHISNQW